MNKEVSQAEPQASLKQDPRTVTQLYKIYIHVQNKPFPLNFQVRNAWQKLIIKVNWSCNAAMFMRDLGRQRSK